MNVTDELTEPTQLTPELPTIASYWTGADLSWFEQVTIKSYIARGHKFVLYTAGDIGNIPDGTDLRDAAEIGAPVLWPIDYRQGRTCFANLFRLYMIRQTGFIWSDLDAYCIRAFDWDTDWIYGIIKRNGKITNGILKLPPDSVELQKCIDFNELSNPIPPWFPPKRRKALRLIMRSKQKKTVNELPWGVGGPGILNHTLKESGADKHALPLEVLYAKSSLGIQKLIPNTAPFTTHFNKNAHSLHLFGENKGFLRTEYGGIPPLGTFFDQMCRAHDIDPAAAPIL